jgi:hypothetical protein
MPESLLFVLYHFSDFLSGRHIHILRRQLTDICTTFDTFCIATEASPSLRQPVLWRWEEERGRCHGKRCVAAIER